MSEEANVKRNYKHLLIDTTSAGVCTITLNRPERLNAVNVTLTEEIPAAINEASADDEVRVIVITGAGRGFCAGLDLDPENRAAEMELRNSSRQQRLDDLAWVGRQTLAIVQSDKPIIAAINGPAVGAGLGLALATDIRLMAMDAVITTGYMRRGLCPDAGVSYFLPRLIGLSRASELILTARNVTAEEAERIGLVSRVFPSDNFRDAVANYAAELAAGPPIALTLAKRLLTTSLDNDLVSQLKNELTGIMKCFNTEDVNEAMQAFLEKRPPQFKGR